MPSVINTNLASLNTQRNLNTSQASLNVSLQRLSSGMRVNSAKDDAAGLAIAERMTTQMRGLNVAARNANDGVSLAQTAEGALGKIGEMVQRIRELAVQSSNATNSTDDRGALQEEVSQLLQEIDRVAKTTSFNEKKLLDGNLGTAKFQVGANVNEFIEVSGIPDATAAQLGSITMASSQHSGTLSDLTQVAAGTLEINGVAIDQIAAASTDAERLEQVAAAINAKSEQHKVTASYDKGTGKLTLRSDSTFTIDASDPAKVGLTTTDGATGTSVTGMAALTVSTQDAAQSAIKQADAALKTINTARAKLGALQSRFESAIANIQIASENTSAARSRIMDADFASETAALTRAQILQQAGNAMLSQANQLPQQVLSLLK